MDKIPRKFSHYFCARVCLMRKFSANCIFRPVSPAGNLLHVFGEMPPCVRKGSCLKKKAPKLKPRTDIQTELCCHLSGVIFYTYTTKYLSILPKTAISLSHDTREASVSSQHAKCTFLRINSYLLLQRYFH